MCILLFAGCALLFCVTPALVECFLFVSFCLAIDLDKGEKDRKKQSRLRRFSLPVAAELYVLDFPIIINRESPLSFLGASGVIFIFYHILRTNRIAPDGTPRSAASHLWLCCLPMSYKKDARLELITN